MTNLKVSGKAKTGTSRNQGQPELARTTNGQADQPAWVQELISKYASNVARLFLLHGNTADYPVRLGENLRSYLTNLLMAIRVTSPAASQSQSQSHANEAATNAGAGQEAVSLSHFGIVVLYSRASRFSFPTPEMKKKFIEIAASQATATKLIPPITEQVLNEHARNPAIALQILSSVLAYRGEDATPIAVMVEYTETLTPAAETLSEADRTCYTILADWTQDQIAGARGVLQRMRHAVLLLTENPKSLYEPLRRAIKEQMALPLPDYAARLSFLKEIFSSASYQSVPLANGVTLEDIARLTPGLGLISLEDIVLAASYQREPVSLAHVRRRKDELVAGQFDDVLTIKDPRVRFAQVGGMFTAKEFLAKHVIGPMKAGKRERVPNGLLLTGPSGTGKTLLAEAVAGELGCTFVQFKIEKIKQMYVGQSERNMARALAALEVINPAVLFIDEIDQMVSQSRDSGGDSGTSNNIFAMLLAWAADTQRRGKVLLIAATNRPDLMDSAMKREGRFDLKIPILVPDAPERAAILAVQLARYFPAGVAMPQANELEALTEQMPDYTGAILERVASTAFGEWDEAEGELSLMQALETAFEAVIATTQDIEVMTRLALETCSDMRVVPEQYRPQLLRLKKASGGDNDSGDRGAVIRGEQRLEF